MTEVLSNIWQTCWWLCATAECVIELPVSPIWTEPHEQEKHISQLQSFITKQNSQQFFLTILLSSPNVPAFVHIRFVNPSSFPDKLIILNAKLLIPWRQRFGRTWLAQVHRTLSIRYKLKGKKWPLGILTWCRLKKSRPNQNWRRLVQRYIFFSIY